MKRGIFLSIGLLLFSLTGCGGGGGGGTSTVVVTGIASKGPFISGTVNVYDVSAGIGSTQRKLLQTGTINSDGKYNIRIAPTTNPVMLEITPGSNVQYIDEANSRHPRSLAGTPLRAIVPSVAADTPIVVSAFTELAVRKVEAGSTVDATAIRNANNLVAQLYQLPDITSTEPVDSSTTIPNNASRAQINYGLALAAVAQMMKNQVDSALDTNLTTLAVQSNNTITGSAVTSFQSAVTNYLATNPPVAQDVPNIGSSPFGNVGTAVTTGIQASKTTALANGNDSVTVTASFSASIPDNTDITFTVSSGPAKFPGDVTTVTKKTSGGTATATITSGTVGSSVITATYGPGSSANVTVSFVAPPTITLQASKAIGVPNGSDLITFTATPVSVAVGYDTVTFAISSGSGTFDNNQNTKTVALSGGSAAAGLKSSAVGDVVVTATYAVSSTASKTVKFAQPATAILDVGLKTSFNSVVTFGFRMKSLPVGSVSWPPAHALIAANSSLSDASGANTESIFTVNYFRSSTLYGGFTITANVPVARLTYTIPAGQSPQFTLTLEDVNNSTLTPLQLADPNNTTQAIAPNPALTANDYFVNITYKDLAGNTLLTVTQ